ncbi:MAG TPA: murein biosynthesis integral membrane protein MurJ [Gemmatimonadaceae bacterium]|nr:murein biosynthesis integral membrane protein MurJ [Gemmatimonadaceae bacterium]
MTEAAQPPPPRPHSGSARFATLVGAGILLSRLFGLVRQRVLAHFLGLSSSADAFGAGFRIPNLLQNLFGEGVLSASFIPVYSRLLARGEHEEARRLAGAVFAFLSLIVAVIVLAGILATPWLIDLIAPGFEGEKRILTIRIVRVLFPGMGLLALSAWCLGILNSHRRFFLPYVAPVVWNAAIIASLVLYAGRVPDAELAVVAAWGSVVGSALQLFVQLPAVLRLVRGIRANLERDAHLRTVGRSFAPAFLGRGVVQIGAYVDTLIASLLPTGAVAALANAQMLYTLPVSLFGMSISAAALPEMASDAAHDEAVGERLNERLHAGLRRIAFFVIPSAAVFLALGDVVAAALFETGEFTRNDSIYVWSLLAGSAVGLLASTSGRLYSSVFYALHDTRTPLRFAALRVAIGVALAAVLALYGPELLGIAPRWGAAGITIASGFAAWLELILLRSALRSRLGIDQRLTRLVLTLWVCAAIAALAAWGMKLAVGQQAHPWLMAAIVLGAFGIVYLIATLVARIDEARALFARASRAR